ncbi:MAG TPA: glycosyltransferase family 4 protein [Actinomycetales bacterium]|nr:glycosyltransferase family 4 protein [Actinomycetales bacterium]
MRILHVSDVYEPRLGGIERQVADLAAQQRRRGHRSTVLTATHGPAGPHLLRWPSAMAQPLTALQHTAPDVVHCHSSVMSPLAWSVARAASRRGVPTVVTMHSLVASRSLQSLPLRALAARLPAGVVWSAVSTVAATALQGVVGRDVQVLHNGIDPSWWRTSDVGTRSPLTVVSVMRLAARKRPLSLVHTLHEVDRHLGGSVPWTAVIAGSGPQETAVRREIGRRGLEDVVRLAGRLEHAAVVDLLARSDLYVAPALLESFGIAALEARCAGVPVVGVRGTGVAEFVRHDVDGLLVDDGSEMVDAVAGLLREPARLRDLARASAESAPRQSWSHVLQRCDELYERAAWQTSGAHRTAAVH